MWVRLEFSQVKHLSYVSPKGKPTNNRLGWKGLPAYLAYIRNCGRKKFYNIGNRMDLQVKRTLSLHPRFRDNLESFHQSKCNVSCLWYKYLWFILWIFNDMHCLWYVSYVIWYYITCWISYLLYEMYCLWYKFVFQI